jgi:uncharacterized repeat protein (TIGR01451 family)
VGFDSEQGRIEQQRARRQRASALRGARLRRAGTAAAVAVVAVLASALGAGVASAQPAQATIEVVLSAASGFGVTGAVNGAAFALDTGTGVTSLTPVGGVGTTCITGQPPGTTAGTCTLTGAPNTTYWVAETSPSAGDALSAPVEVATGAGGTTTTAEVTGQPADCTAASSGSSGSCYLTTPNGHDVTTDGSVTYAYTASSQQLALTLPASSGEVSASDLWLCVGPVAMSFALDEAADACTPHGSLITAYGATQVSFTSVVDDTQSNQFTYDFPVPSGQYWFVHLVSGGNTLEAAAPAAAGAGGPSPVQGRGAQPQCGTTSSEQLLAYQGPSPTPAPGATISLTYLDETALCQATATLTDETTATTTPLTVTETPGTDVALSDLSDLQPTITAGSAPNASCTTGGPASGTMPCTGTSPASANEEGLAFSVPTGLAPGQYTVTLTVEDGDDNDQTVTWSFTVSPVTPTVGTQVSAGQVPLGAAGVTDGVTVQGTAAGGAPTGTVTFSVCGPMGADATCTPSTSNQVGTPVTLSPGTGDASTATSAPVPPSNLGVYCFAAVYQPATGSVYATASDDTSGTPVTSECFDVVPATPVVTTQVSATQMTVGAATGVTDAVTVQGNGDGGAPVGTVTFSLCGPMAADATCAPSASNQVGTSVTVTAGTADASTGSSTAVSPTAPGTYCFSAVFTPAPPIIFLAVPRLGVARADLVDPTLAYTSSSDDTGTAPGTAVEPSECFRVVSPAAPPLPPTPVTAAAVATTTSTHLSAAVVPVGQPVTDTALVASGTAAPAGTVLFSVCGPLAADATCTPSPSNPVGGAVAVTPGSGDTSTASSTSFSPTTAGVYCFSAVFTPATGSVFTGSSDDTSGTADPAECVEAVAPALTVVKTSSPPSGATVAPGGLVTYVLTLHDAGAAMASGVTVTDAAPAGTTYVAGSATCGDVPTTVCSVTEQAGAIVWRGVAVPAATAAGEGTAVVSFEVRVDPTDTTGQVITNIADFTNEGTPACTTATCPTDPDRLTVVVPATSSATSLPPVTKATSSTAGPVPVPGATTVHTGEPWAGAGPWEAAAAATGAVLIGFGVRRRRLLRRMTR